ncbi:hypothetical protein [Aminobacter niigataensis]|uniref:hypothetical protein n=1 Tax=Aminobacter niigataensis TaxID=83265 RepID=UPI0024CB249A|nr:hypothetical protein [Aminobacter niigataensis]CAI2932034.1 protein of unknown function [Aminobacter niigataensis]
MTPKRTKAPSVEAPQIDKFREAARELETDQSEESFNRALKKVAKAEPKEKTPDLKK